MRSACYKFRRPTIGQNCSAVCTNKGGHRARDAFAIDLHIEGCDLRSNTEVQSSCCCMCTVLTVDIQLGR